MLKSTICGNYPKIDSGKSPVNLRLAINRLEKGKITHEEYMDVLNKTIERTINDQVEAGISLITDGQITWTDLTSPFCKALSGVEAGGLRRFFDNNIYYRRPQITGPIKREKPIIADELSAIKELSSRPVKAVLCGPVTFMLLSDDQYYHDIEKFVWDISQVIREEILELQALGIEYIQLDEPALPQNPDLIPLAINAFTEICEGTSIKIGVAFYFNAIKSIIPHLNEFPVDFFALDFVSHPDEVDLLPNLRGKELHAGLINARSVRLEDMSLVLSRIDQLREQVQPDDIYLTTSCGLEFLPRNYAVSKMAHMTEIAEKA
jgi:5-methyltetrahydropteroyltriglutamate--homocysteine methyltransferase